MSRYATRISTYVFAAFVLAQSQHAAEPKMPELVTTVEGISEYRLANGMRVLLFPDPTKDTVTVNNTIFVGSRHEGYGEAGMAHLLEHMVFKGTPNHPNIPKALRDHGAGRSMNGTTWLDRTNYYETMPATDENLEFAIRLEADRMINSNILAEDLASEMTVVRNEFERGENSPSRVLQQRITSAAFDWHNYGQSTIGNRADIERVPIEKLRQFYERYYQPDNAMLVISGSFHPRKALEYVDKYFGSIPKPDRELDPTYTEEPAQDGERRVTLRRVGDVALVGASYHIVSGPHPDFATVDILATSMIQAPSGRLYKALVETKQAASVSGGVFPTHDPNLMMFTATLVQGVDPELAAEIMTSTLEEIVDKPITEEEVERSRSRLLSDWETASRNSQSIAIGLSNWASQGDWRLFFLYRDRLELTTVEDVQRVATEYLVRNNRTLGIFVPTKKAQRVEIPPTPDLAKMIGDYEGRGEVEMGEKFDVSFANIDARSQRSELPGGIKVVALPKKTRGGVVNMRLTLRFGDVDSLQDKSAEVTLLGPLMTRGTKNRSRQQIRDELNQERSQLQISSRAGSLTCRIQTTRDKIGNVLDIMSDILNNPAFPEGEFATLKQAYVASLEQQLSDPQALAPISVLRKMRPYGPGDPRYVATTQEDIDLIKEVTVDDVRSLYDSMISGKHGELTVIGDFDPKQVTSTVDKAVEKLKGTERYQRIRQDRGFDLNEEYIQIETPDKANAVYFSGTVIRLRDDHPDYPALLIGNDIFGGAGALASRLGDRVRQKEGLSYGIGSRLQVSAYDNRSAITIYAITNPDNSSKVKTAIAEEMELIRTQGVTEEEVTKAIASYIQSQTVRRTDDANLASIIEKNTEAGRTMEFEAKLQDHIQKLTADEVNAAIKKYFQPTHFVTTIAGDFAATKQK